MWTRILLAAVAGCLSAVASDVSYPYISPDRIPVAELELTDQAYAAVRQPPGAGPFPAIVFLHGGLGHSSMSALRENAVDSPVQARFLAWGYVTVSATRRAIADDPLDRGVIGDVLAIVQAVRAMPSVDPDSVALYGGSGGGTLALEVASVSDRLAAVVAGEPATIIYMEMLTKEHIVFDAEGRRTGDRRWDVMKADPKQLYTPVIQRRTRAKLQDLATPVLILHGDQHPLRKFNLGVFVPEMQALGKAVTVKTYPGEYHGFYWGQGRIPSLAKKSNVNAEAWLRERLPTAPSPVSPDWIEQRPVEALPAPDPN